MHTLLDNPFGRHCAKFPPRAQITELMNTCRSLLSAAEMVPECFSVRHSEPTSSSQASPQEYPEAWCARAGHFRY